MDPQTIKEAITKIAAIHAQSGDSVDDIKETDFQEQEAFNLIISYCHDLKHKVDEFPSASTDYDELTDEHWMLYLDKLTLLNEEVAQLHWHWVISFWPDEYESFEVFLEMIKARIRGSFYDLKLI